MTATINNNTVSQNMADTLPILLRIVDPEEFARYDCMTPTALDYLSDYRDGVHKMEYQIDAGATGGTADNRPRSTTQDQQRQIQRAPKWAMT